MRVSVIVPTRNSARTLGACLGSIRAQTYSDLEVLVVDNSSTDETREIAPRLSDIVVVGGPERSAQRNRGARLAKGAAFFFVDSDLVLEPTVVTECVDAAAAGADAVVVPEESFGEGFWARSKALERSCYLEDGSIEAARFFTREIFELIDGYDEALVGEEDWDLHARATNAGARVGRAVARIWHDEGPLRLHHLIVKKFQYGKTLGRYAQKHPALARSQLRLFRPAFLRHRGRLARSPLLTCGMLVMKAAEAAAAAAGLIVALATAPWRNR
jgi:glycosyltransferase involved in cell wall biosynthesis